MKVLKHNGLVPMTIKQAFRNYRGGETVRFSAADAQRFLEAGLVAEAKVPKGAATVAVAAAAPVTEAKILPQDLPAISENWQDLHILQRANLARQIARRADVKGPEADQIIKDELARRAAE